MPFASGTIVLKLSMNAKKIIIQRTIHTELDEDVDELLVLDDTVLQHSQHQQLCCNFFLFLVVASSSARDMSNICSISQFLCLSLYFILFSSYLYHLNLPI